MDSIILVSFVPSIFSICASLLKGQSTTEQFNLSTIFIAAFTLFYIIEVLFVLCYFGNILTISLVSVSDTIYKSEWYNYPTDCQRFLIIMIRRAHKPYRISAFGLMPCTLENFKSVCCEYKKF